MPFNILGMAGRAASQQGKGGFSNRCYATHTYGKKEAVSETGWRLGSTNTSPHTIMTDSQSNAQRVWQQQSDNSTKAPMTRQLLEEQPLPFWQEKKANMEFW